MLTSQGILVTLAILYRCIFYPASQLAEVLQWIARRRWVEGRDVHLVEVPEPLPAQEGIANPFWPQSHGTILPNKTRWRKEATGTGGAGDALRAHTARKQQDPTHAGYRAAAKKAMAALGASGLSARAKKGAATMGAAGLSAKIKKAMTTMGAAGLSARAKKITANLGAAGLSARKKKAEATLGAAARSAITKKSRATLRGWELAAECEVADQFSEHQYCRGPLLAHPDKSLRVTVCQYHRSLLYDIMKRKEREQAQGQQTLDMWINQGRVPEEADTTDSEPEPMCDGAPLPDGHGPPPPPPGAAGLVAGNAV